MSPQPYLFHVNTQPYGSHEGWRKWYIQEHFPDLINSGLAVRVTLYEETPLPFGEISKNPGQHRKFLALWQTDHPELMEAEQVQHLRMTSELFREEGSTSDQYLENGEFNARNFKLIQEYDPLEICEVPSPYVLTVEMHPKHPEDLDKWYREEHLDMLRQVPGYRRSLRYRFDSRSDLTKGDFQPDFLTIHECNDLVGWSGKEA